MYKAIKYLGLTLLFAVAPFVAAVTLLPEGGAVSAGEYRSKIAIEGLFAGRGTAGEQIGLPLVWFRLRNTGRETVDEVRVRISFLNRYGDVVHVADFYPVHQGDYGLGKVDPLEPGDVWQMSNIRYYMPSGIPHTWEPGAVKAQVVSIRFGG